MPKQGEKGVLKVGKREGPFCGLLTRYTCFPSDALPAALQLAPKGPWALHLPLSTLLSPQHVVC